MKAERRHQLQNNALAQQIETFPEMVKRNASKIMLVITAGLLAAFIVRYRMNAAEGRQIDLANAMFRIHQAPLALRQYDGSAMLQYSPSMLAQARRQVASDVNDAVETILREAEGDAGAQLRAEALIGRGDLNWALANLGELPGAATQPMLQLPRTSADYLKQAEDAYRNVITSYSGVMLSWVSAEMGLGAIAENRHDWPAAKEAYGAIVANPSAPAVYKELASQRILIFLPQIEAPLFIGTYPPSTAPTIGTTTAPMDLPTTAPVTAPTTAPSTQSMR